MTSPLLRDVIDIPEGLAATDLVLDLNRGVEDAAGALAHYTITDRLKENFDEALSLIRRAMATGDSTAAYLHGSFGAGKSHFMAVLYALLNGAKEARGRDEFSDLVAKHAVWLDGKRFLLVPAHMMNADSLEQRVLGSYVHRMAQEQPHSRAPAVHRTDGLLAQAARVRAQVGDAAFLARLPGGMDAEDDEWGESGGWTSQRLDAAFAAASDDERRRSLVIDLLASWCEGYFADAVNDAAAFIPLDRGLVEITRHAKGNGFDGVILFIDELILWIANRAADREFVGREIQKITALVEGGDERRAVPVVTFIARQRDLRELIGNDVTEAHQLSFHDTLALASGRFEVIYLEDRNLPAIAQERVLRPRTPAAREEIDKAFEATTKIRQEIWDLLLGSDTRTGSNRDAFRQSYPFSPVFMDTLVHVSNALQRTRSGLKLMLKLLINRRDELRVGDLVPIGDLYEVISEPGDAPFTEKLKAEFAAAQKLYQGRLRPGLLAEHDLTEDDMVAARQRGADSALVARVRRFTDDNRLMQTLLLAALAPTVPALQNLTARRLHALNYGTIRTRIKGEEVTLVAGKLREWAARFSEIRLTEGDDPGVSLHLVGVDVDSVLDQVAMYNTSVARRALVRSLLWEELGLRQPDSLLETAAVVWRGTARSVELVYGKVRDVGDVTDAMFTPDDPHGWRLIIDYPLEEGTTSPADARSRIHKLTEQGQPRRTLCWVPSALTTERVNRDLSRLLKIDTAVRGDFDRFAAHLDPDDRLRARDQLTHQAETLRGTLRRSLRQAYGLAQQQATDVNLGYDEHLLGLMPGFAPTLPAGASFADALRRLAEQMFDQQYPQHPQFDPDHTGVPIRPADLKVVLEAVRTVLESGVSQAEIESRPQRAVLARIAGPLRVGEMASAVFKLDRHWEQHFRSAAATAGVDLDAEVPVSTLRGWLPSGMGLDRATADLVIMVYAELANRGFYLHGGPAGSLDPGRLNAPGLALRPQHLPSQQQWDNACERFEALSDQRPIRARVGRLVSLFSGDLSRWASGHRDAAHTLYDRLRQHAADLGLDESAPEGRLATATQAIALLDVLAGSSGGVAVIEALADADLTGAQARRLGRHIRTAAQVGQALATGPWSALESLRSVPAEYAAEVAAVRDRLIEAARVDELSQPLAPALRRAQDDATGLIQRALRARDPKPPPPPPGTMVDRRDLAASDPDAATAALRALLADRTDNQIIKLDWTLR